MLYSNYSGHVYAGPQDSPQGEPESWEKVRLLDASALDDLHVHGKTITYAGNRHGAQSLYGKYFMMFMCSGIASATHSVGASNFCEILDEGDYLAAIAVEIETEYR